MVAGIVLFAFAMKTTLADATATRQIPALDSAVVLRCICSPSSVSVHVFRTLRGGRLIAAIAFAALWPVAVLVPRSSR